MRAEPVAARPPPWSERALVVAARALRAALPACEGRDRAVPSVGERGHGSIPGVRGVRKAVEEEHERPNAALEVEALPGS